MPPLPSLLTARRRPRLHGRGASLPPILLLGETLRSLGSRGRRAVDVAVRVEATRRRTELRGEPHPARLRAGQRPASTTSCGTWNRLTLFSVTKRCVVILKICRRAEDDSRSAQKSPSTHRRSTLLLRAREARQQAGPGARPSSFCCLAGRFSRGRRPWTGARPRPRAFVPAPGGAAIDAFADCTVLDTASQISTSKI